MTRNRVWQFETPWGRFHFTVPGERPWRPTNEYLFWSHAPCEGREARAAGPDGLHGRIWMAPCECRTCGKVFELREWLFFSAFTAKLLPPDYNTAEINTGPT